MAIRIRNKQRDRRDYRARSTALRKRTQKNNDPCHLCKKPFDFTLPYFDGEAFTADHVVPLLQGGHILGTILPAHRSCNARKNGGQHAERFPTPQQW